MYTYMRTCTFLNVCRTAVTFWLEMLYEVPLDIKHLTKLVCLDVPVVMSFQSYFWILSMGNGMLISRGTRLQCFFTKKFSLAYSEFILDTMIERTADTVEIYVMYDITCTLYKHLKV